eukprot:gene17303-12369_t
MGNADFWVTRIMEGYLPRVKPKLKYPFEDICAASCLTLNGLETDEGWRRALIESRLFDGSKYTLNDIPDFNPDKPSIPNDFLVLLLEEEDERYPNRDGPVRSIVRNWFEFLDSNGRYPDKNAILDTYRGKFTPQFDARFKIKDVIIKQEPSVLSILANHVLGNYGRAGVNYVEFSVSVNDIFSEEEKKSAVKLMEKFTNAYILKDSKLGQCVAGIDWVGDEFGHPYCIFAHPQFIKMINDCRKVNPRFGVRIHAGEGLMRHSTVDEMNYTAGGPLTAPHATFMLHVFILIKSITKVINGIE